MALFCAAIKRNSISLSRFPFHCQVQNISFAISPGIIIIIIK